jgi:hypothetical protein
VSVDAIRLLGCDEEFDDEDQEENVELKATKGIFEIQTAPNNFGNRNSATQSTQLAKDVGFRLRRLLMEHAFTNNSCKTHLQPFVTGSTNRIFNAAIFTAHRWNCLHSISWCDSFSLALLQSECQSRKRWDRLP